MDKGLKTAILSVGACAVLFTAVNETLFIMMLKSWGFEMKDIFWNVLFAGLLLTEILLFTYWGAIAQTKMTLMIASGCMFVAEMISLIKYGFGLHNWFSCAMLCPSIVILIGAYLKNKYMPWSTPAWCIYLKNKYIIVIPLVLCALLEGYLSGSNFDIELLKSSFLQHSTYQLGQLSIAALFGMLAYAVFRYDRLMLLDRPLSAYTPYTQYTPYTPAPAITVDTVIARLDALNADYEAGRISFEEYKQRRMEILKTLGK